jgi:glycosyltransferase involved in cell wall biosynthesis
MKKLAEDLPDYEFVSIGGLIEEEKRWFTKFSQNLPRNYTLKVNLPSSELIDVLHNSRVYVHLMEGEHFGIAPVEAAASGCVTLVHNSGGMKEFISEEFRWQQYADLKEKIAKNIETAESWEKQRQELWKKIEGLNPSAFQDSIWLHIKELIE